jgi:hypothetical protein
MTLKVLYLAYVNINWSFSDIDVYEFCFQHLRIPRGIAFSLSKILKIRITFYDFTLLLWIIPFCWNFQYPWKVVFTLIQFTGSHLSIIVCSTKHTLIRKRGVGSSRLMNLPSFFLINSQIFINFKLIS